MRLLVVLTCYPFPPRTGSTIFAYNSLKQLSKDHEIDLVCFHPGKILFDPAKFVKRLVLIIHRKPRGVVLGMRYLLNMIAGIPPSVSAYKSSAMSEKVKELIKSGKYDAILLFDISAIQFCPSSWYSKLIVHIEDPLSIKGYSLLDLPVLPPLERAKIFVASKVARIYEKRVFPLMAKVLLLSESDKQYLYEQGFYDNLGFVPYGIDQKDTKEIVDYERREKVIVFSGNMYHPPNVDGALYFLRDIFPLILMQHPSAVLWIVGNAPDARIYAAASKFSKQVVITGRVDDVADYIKRAAVSICSVRLKIGVQTKILEALSWGTPVVTTSAGKSGIEGLSGHHFWIEDDPQQFANRVVELLQGIGWLQLSEEGRLLAEKNFSWEGSTLQLEQYLEAVISKSKN